MKIPSLNDGRDGCLIVVSHHLSRLERAPSIPSELSRVNKGPNAALA
jgi:hypothetical protein